MFEKCAKTQFLFNINIPGMTLNDGSNTLPCIIVTLLNRIVWIREKNCYNFFIMVAVYVLLVRHLTNWLNCNLDIGPMCFNV